MIAATWPADDRKPASAEYTWSGTPARLTQIKDPVSSRTVELRYQGRHTCPAPPAVTPAYDPAPPPGMLCAVDYPVGTDGAGRASTKLYYQAGLLVAVEDPGGELTQFGYDQGRMTKLRDSLATDWVARDPAVRNTDASYSLIGYDPAGRVASVRSPEPTGTAVVPTQRVGHTYGYVRSDPNAPVSTVTVDGDPVGVVARTVTMDMTGRPTVEVDATGVATRQGWSVEDELLWSQDGAGRVTSYGYDTASNQTDLWGPWRGDCFMAIPAGDGNGPRTPLDTAGCKSAMSHTHTDYDSGISGLGTAWYANTSLNGAATSHSTTAPAQWGTSKPHEALPAAAGWSGRMSGELRNVPAGTYTFAAQVDAGADDGVRVFLDDQLVLERWDTIAESVLDDRPVGYWRLGETSGTTAADSSGNGRTGSYAGASLGRPGAAVGDPNTAAGFAPASGSRVNLPNNPLYGVLRPTIEAWFKTSGTAGGVIFGYQNVAAPGTPTSYVPALYVGTNGYLYGRYWPGTAESLQSLLPVNDNAWHHTALVLDEANKQTLWLDGQPVDQGTGGVDWLQMNTAAVGAGRTEAWPAGKIGGVHHFTGDIDEVAVYDRPLDGSRIAAHWRAGKATFDSVSQKTGPTLNGRWALSGQPQRFRVDVKNPAGAMNLRLTATPAGGGTPIELAGDKLGPRYGLATRITVDDSGGATPTQVTDTSFADIAAKIDPVLGLATATTEDPGGLALTTRTGYETYLQTGSFLRRLSRALPAGDLAVAAKRTSTVYYADAETRDKPVHPGRGPGGAVRAGQVHHRTDTGDRRGAGFRGRLRRVG